MRGRREQRAAEAATAVEPTAPGTPRRLTGVAGMDESMLASSLATERQRLIGVDKYAPRTFKARNYAPGRQVIPRAPQEPPAQAAPSSAPPPKVESGQVAGSGLEVDARAAKVAVTNQAMDESLGQAADAALIAAGNKLLAAPNLSPEDKNATLAALANARRIGQRGSEPLAPVAPPPPVGAVPTPEGPKGQDVPPPPSTVADSLMQSVPSISLNPVRRKSNG